MEGKKMKLSEQVAALEARLDAQMPEWIVVAVESYHFRVAQKDRDRYTVRGGKFESQGAAEGYLRDIGALGVRFTRT